MNEFILDKNDPVKTFGDLDSGTIFILAHYPDDLYMKIRDLRAQLNANCISLRDGLFGLCSDKDEILAVYTKFKVME